MSSRSSKSSSEIIVSAGGSTGRGVGLNERNPSAAANLDAEISAWNAWGKNSTAHLPAAIRCSGAKLGAVSQFRTTYYQRHRDELLIVLRKFAMHQSYHPDLPTDDLTAEVGSSYCLANRSHCHPTLRVLKFVPVRTATPELYASFNDR